MLDSLLTLTKNGVLWFAIAETIAVLFHFGITAVVGTTEPIFLVAALAIPAAFLVAGFYTVGRNLRHAIRGGPTQPTK